MRSKGDRRAQTPALPNTINIYRSFEIRNWTLSYIKQDRSFCNADRSRTRNLRSFLYSMSDVICIVAPVSLEISSMFQSLALGVFQQTQYNSL